LGDELKIDDIQLLKVLCEGSPCLFGMCPQGLTLIIILTQYEIRGLEYLHGVGNPLNVLLDCVK
jgi:hypothetical protein